MEQSWTAVPELANRGIEENWAKVLVAGITVPGNTGGLFGSGKKVRVGKKGRPKGRPTRPDYLHNPNPCRRVEYRPEKCTKASWVMDTLDKVASSPGQVYDYVHGNCGLPGLIVAGVVIVVGVIGVFIALDRRKYFGLRVGAVVKVKPPPHHLTLISPPPPASPKSRSPGSCRCITSPGFRKVPVASVRLPPVFRSRSGLPAPG